MSTALLPFLLFFSGFLLLAKAADAQDDAYLSRYHVSTQVKSRLANTAIEMEFVNPERDCSQIHSVVLQLPRNARLTHLEMDLSDGCQLDSQVKHLETAVEDFQQQSSQGKPAALLQASWDMVNYELKVSIPPNGSTNVVLGYSELLYQKLGQVDFQIPIFPGTPVGFLGMDISVEDLDGGILELYTEPLPEYQDEVFQTTNNPASASVLFETSNVPEDSTLPRLMGAYYRPGPLPDEGILLSDGDGCFTHIFNPTTFLADAGSMARKIVFVIDVSGSMGGQKLDDAKASFNAMIDTLEDRDTLIVQTFSSQGTEEVWGPELATSESRNQAKQFVDRLQTISGTNLNDAFVDGIATVRDAPEEMVPILVILTDGKGNIGPQVTARNIRVANAGSRKVKIFALAFGDDADMDLLLGIAIQNGGQARRIYEGFGDAVSQMELFYKQELGTILLSDIDVSYDLGEDNTTPLLLQDSTLMQFPVLAGGSEIVVRGKLDKTAISPDTILRSAVSARSAIGTNQWSSEFSMFGDGTATLSNECQQTFAQARIKELLEYRDAARALGDELFPDVDGDSVTTASSRSGLSSSNFEEDARQIALDSRLVWPGLTALVTIENQSCQQNSYEICPTDGDEDEEDHEENDEGGEATVTADVYDAGALDNQRSDGGDSGSSSCRNTPDAGFMIFPIFSLVSLMIYRLL